MRLFVFFRKSSLFYVVTYFSVSRNYRNCNTEHGEYEKIDIVTVHYPKFEVV